jgi:hypothetical protein
MLPSGVEIIGIAAVELAHDALVLHVVLSDGSTGATHWPLADLAWFVAVIDAEPHVDRSAPPCNESLGYRPLSGSERYIPRANERRQRLPPWRVVGTSCYE